MSGHNHVGVAGNLGLSENGVRAAWARMDQAIAQKLIPGGVVMVSRKGHSLAYAAGYAVDTPDMKRAAEPDTIYDCASLTKVVVTLPLILQLAQEGMLSLEEKASAYVPEFAYSGKHNITILQLLAHTSGLAGHGDLYSHGWSPEEIIQEICRMEPVYEPGTQCVYSCLGYIILGQIVERLLGMGLAKAAEERIFRPLAMSDSCFNPDPSLHPRIAATEYDDSLGMYRLGRVHDENCDALGGIAGNAGLFATAADLIAYAQIWLKSLSGSYGYASLPLGEEAVRQSLKSYTSHIPGAHRGLGWVLRGDQADPGGSGLSAASFGHTGFTGTSLWVDPEQDLMIAILTNRVHYGRGTNIKELRSGVHQALAAAICD